MGGNGIESENPVVIDLIFPDLCPFRFLIDHCLFVDGEADVQSKLNIITQMTSDKAGAALLADIFVKKGLEHIVISPGSRNAPLVISFAQNPRVKAISIVDERSAAFFALGMAQQTNKAVAITCTSGGAVLNYAPAIAEAYYQKVPLLVITADRPKKLIDHGDGQTIRQKNVYANYVKASFEIQGEIENEKDFHEAVKIVNEAIDLTSCPGRGPVHINIPFAEPIYKQVHELARAAEVLNPMHNVPGITDHEIKKFADTWNATSKKLVIAGMMDPDPEMQRLLKKIAKDPSVVVLAETTSNLMHDCFCPGIDKVVNTVTDKEAEFFKPELLVTFGGNVISKMIKAFLRKNSPAQHWHIDPDDPEMNTYQCLSDGIKMNPLLFFEKLLIQNKPVKSDYFELWKSRDDRSEERHKKYLENCEYSDLKVFEALLEFIPEYSNIQLGNSTPVRYGQLFKQKKEHIYHSNRGTSGIDGTVSTAAGAAYVSYRLTTLITGDLGFMYDSNALMNHHLSTNLRIIIINNNGGGIFRFISGPDETEQLEEFFEAHHTWTAEYVAKNFDVSYYSVSNMEELKTSLSGFYSPQKDNKPAILEIHTPNKKNARILKSYFNYLKE